jgi:phage gpG-like protein
VSDAASIDYEDKNLGQALSKFKLKLSMMHKAPELRGIIASVVFKDIMKHFDDEKGPKGKWAPWSKSYRDAINRTVAFRYWNGRVVPITDPKQLKKYKPPRNNGKILQTNKARLRQSFMPQNHKVLKDGLLFYNKAKTKDGFPYAAAHDEGGPKLPQRKFMWLSKEGAKDILGQIMIWLKK